jgi:MiaB/RimO family radical SAM methylthiotransferase
VAYLKLASGCDRRCTFCAIPSFRGSFISRTPETVLAEASWLASSGARELVLVSENSTSYGKDLANLRALETLLPDLAAIDGIERVRVSYLQPAELRPSLLEVIATTPGVAAYFDLSFQHASETVLRRMKRFGSSESFLDLLARARALAPDAGARSNIIVGFPGETEEDLSELEYFLQSARLDAVGVFGYSDEEGTEALGLPDKVEQSQIADRVARLTVISRKAMDDRAAERVGSEIEVIVKHPGRGWAAHQAPAVDGFVTLTGNSAEAGDVLRARVTGQDGANLIAEALAK